MSPQNEKPLATTEAASQGLPGMSHGDTSRSRPVDDTSASPSSAPQQLPETFGRYRILKKLGQGGMGAVYLAHDTQLDRQVALKVPRFSAEEGQQAVERFLRGSAAATLHHPNLCPVHDVGVINDIHYMTMAYIEGHLLSEYIRPGKPAPERQSAAVVRKMALALQEAHARGIVHRDLKPTNVMLNQRGEPIIMDFGLARRAQRDEVALTQTGSVLGTPAYMAPEQARGQSEAIGPCSDIYALGVILYELLTSQRPFRGELLQVLSKILTEEPEQPSACRPGLAPRLEAICLKAMAKNPAARYASMSELAAALNEYVQQSGDHGSTSVVAPAGAGAKGAATASALAPVSSERAAGGEVAMVGSADQPQPTAAADDASYGLNHLLDGLSRRIPDTESAPSLPEPGEGQLPPGTVASGPSDTHDAAKTPAAGGPSSAVARRRGRRVTTPSAKPGVRSAPALRRGRPSASPLALLARLSQRQKVGAAIAVGVVFALVLLGIVFKLHTPDGTLVVELDDSEAVVQVLNEEGKLLIQRKGEKGTLVINVDPGKRRLRVEKDGLELFAKDVTIAAGGRETVRARLEAATPSSLPPLPRSKEAAPTASGKKPAGKPGALMTKSKPKQPAPSATSSPTPSTPVVAATGDAEPARVEQAIALGLDWLVRQQTPDGKWELSSAGTPEAREMAATAFALIPLVRTGSTHTAGKHQQAVARGLKFVTSRQAPDGDLRDGANMYTHGLAAIALCEAYARSRDPALRAPAQKGVEFIVRAQHPTDGGWRYGPGDQGDTSVLGWQFTPLMIAKDAGLAVPDETLTRVTTYLNRVQVNQGAEYAYTPGGGGGKATSAIGLLCRTHLGWDSTSAALRAGVQKITAAGPLENNSYHTYYATRLLHRYGGEEWRTWRPEVQRRLLATQERDGAGAGSWSPQGDAWGSQGGRLMKTSLALMTLSEGH